MNKYYFIERWWTKICDITFDSILFQFPIWNDFHCWHSWVLCYEGWKRFVTQRINKFLPRKQRSISNMYFRLRFLSRLLFPPSSGYRICCLRCGFEKKTECRRQTKKVNSKTAKKFIGNWVFWWISGGQSMKMENPHSFLHPNATPIHTDKKTFTPFFISKNYWNEFECTVYT